MQREARAAVTPVRQRTQFSCMAASMMMCLRANNHDVTEDEVNKVMGARPMKGAAWEQALATAQHYGCRATLTMPATVEQLKMWTDAGIPIMIAWNPEGRPWSHASVVFDVDDDLNVYVADPNIPNPKETVRVVSEDDFYGKWYEQFPDYLVRRPACAIEREVTVVGQQVMPRDHNDPTAFVGFGARTASTKTAYGVSVKRLRSGDVVVNAGPAYKKDTIKFLERGGWDFRLIEDRAGSWILPRATVESVDEVMRALAPVSPYLKTARHPETTEQAALGAVWDVFQGIGDVSERDSFETAASAWAISVAGMSDLFGDRGYKLSRTVESMERHSRKWRSAWTLWVTKGYDIDIGRLINDLRKTGTVALKFQKTSDNLKKAIDRSPESWVGMDDEYARSARATANLIKRVNHAIGVLTKHGKTARNLRDNDGRVWGPKRGLEGPLPFKGGRILYYDPREGAYYDPTTDLYLSNAQAMRLAFDTVANKLVIEARAKRKKKPQSQKDKMKVNRKKTKPRSEPAKALAERGGTGSGSHKNKKDYARGHARRPKHRKDMYDRMAGLVDRVLKAGASSFWQPVRHGWKHVDDEIIAHLSWEDVYETVRDTNIPDEFDVADPEMIADGIPELMESYSNALEDHKKWLRQGWWPKPVKVKNGGLHLMILNRQRKKAFEARFKKSELRKAQAEGERAAEVIRGSKRPRWMKPVRMGGYTGNPDGKDIYPEKVDHGEYQALTGGTDIMTRLQDELRVEQGQEVRNPQPRLAGDTPEISIKGRRVKVNDAFAEKLKQMHRSGLMKGSPRNGFTIVHPAADDDPNFNGGSEYDFYFRPDYQQPGWWDVGYSPGYLILLQKDGDKMRARTVRSSSNTPQGMKAAHERLLNRVSAEQVRN